MARLSNKVRDKKIREAKMLYIRGFSFQSISDLIEIGVSTIRSWSNEFNWEEARKLNTITVSNMRAQILETFNALQQGKAPNIKADDIAKLASAFEKLSDKKKHLGYMYDCFEDLSAAIAEKATTAKSAKRKEQLLNVLQQVRPIMDEVTDKLCQEALNE